MRVGVQLDINFLHVLEIVLLVDTTPLIRVALTGYQTHVIRRDTVHPLTDVQVAHLSLLCFEFKVIYGK